MPVTSLRASRQSELSPCPPQAFFAFYFFESEKKVLIFPIIALTHSFVPFDQLRFSTTLCCSFRGVAKVRPRGSRIQMRVMMKYVATGRHFTACADGTKTGVNSKRTLKKYPDCTTWRDPKTGNFPLHITCQNGHERSNTNADRKWSRCECPEWKGADRLAYGYEL